MSFDFYMPTRIISGRDSVKNNAKQIALGQKCLIITGRNSAKACGALADVTAALESVGAQWAVYDEITENPLVSVCYDGGKYAREVGADFIIAIGGGSPLDASKAIAAYATNPNIAPLDIYTAPLVKPLPIVAIPTTAGTGSEVNYYSVLTIDGKNVKKTYKNSDSYPKYAILDPKYTESLGLYYTVSTALDAFCHCIEAYLSPKATEISRAFAVQGGKKLYYVLGELAKLSDGDDVLDRIKPYRYDLLTAACAGGITINTAGTSFNHPLGYNLTLYKGIPHGRACGVFMEEYVAYNRKHPEGARLIDEFCSAITGDTPEVMAANIVKWSAVDVKLTDAEITLYVENVKGAGNYANSPYVICDEEKKEIYVKLFG
ncbi:MAG: iron-containing alcohol dehydrogenase [Clostridia bacterium]|nr:iron-containing alcohol dehydrogenase [Clostridia bacterium]